MNIDIKSIPTKALDGVKKLRNYLGFIVIILVLLGFSFLVFEIRRLVISEPSDASISEELNNLRRPKVEQATIDKIKQLESNNIEVHSLFEQARNNPFQE